jgi:hypothetical protein
LASFGGLDAPSKQCEPVSADRKRVSVRPAANSGDRKFEVRDRTPNSAQRTNRSRSGPRRIPEIGNSRLETGTPNWALRDPFQAVSNLRVRKGPRNVGLSAGHREVSEFRECVAGAGGFEPPYGGIKIRCLTAWRRPNPPRGPRCRPAESGRTIVRVSMRRNGLSGFCGFADWAEQAGASCASRKRPRWAFSLLWREFRNS